LKKDPELFLRYHNQKKCPELLAYLLEAYASIARTRPISEHGLAPISFAEIGAWAELVRIPIEPWEVSVLVRLDRVKRVIVAEAISHVR
jgi:hypothetical protein